MSFGQTISDLRRSKGLNQRQLAAAVRKQDGDTISQQYLNDIENGRRSPPGEHLISQMAKALDADPAFLAYIAGQLPPELRDIVHDQDQLKRAIRAFRAALMKRRE